MINEKGLTDQELNTLWVGYKANGSLELRNRLLVHYLPLVKYHSDRVAATLPDQVEVQDLMSYGVFGLINAINSFELSRDIKFQTFCILRIRGAIIDGLRSTDWVPRSVRSRVRQFDQATNHLYAQTGQIPTYDELAKYVKVSPLEFKNMIRDSKVVVQLLLQQERSKYDTGSHREVRGLDCLVDDRITDPSEEVEKRDLRNFIMRGFSRADRLILILRYREQMHFKEIGQTLGLSESRVSQMHSAILALLRNKKRAEFLLGAVA